MKPHRSEDIFAYAKWLTQECQAAGLDAEQYGAEVLIRGASHHLSERVTCKPDDAGRLGWYWSWGAPIQPLSDATRRLGVDEVGDLVRMIANVVAVPLREGGRG